MNPEARTGNAAGTIGFVFAATGDKYVTLARRAARTLKQVMPDVPVDLFTDLPVSDPTLSQIHSLETATHRPKIRRCAAAASAAPSAWTPTS